MSYTPTTSGLPCWYELGTSDLDAARAFYSSVLGWSVVDSGMPGMTYLLGNDAEGFGVAGLMQSDEGPAAWRFYLEVADCDAIVAQAAEAGGTTLSPPADIPGTGRFAVCQDPQGAVFGVLQPAPMDGEAPAVGAFSAQRPGHGAWHELWTSDPAAALDFYVGLVGWAPGDTLPMGNDGTYHLFGAQGQDLGGVMGQGDLPRPAWTTYFAVAGVQAAADLITEGGGTVMHGPVDVPGGGYIAIALDPQGAMFGVTGPLG